ncbi:hypothetical protein ACIP5Y_26400 [Nocardia sp. NPDC088792]|uniref:hypothetical protein n=1 Tax=Nocardia sp. NPDC088792 TaxID=3364332 RepID=UPI00381004B3
MTCSRTSPHYISVAPFALDLVGTDPAESTAASSSGLSLRTTLPDDVELSPVGMV